MIVSMCVYTFNNDVDVVCNVSEIRRRDTCVRGWLAKITQHENVLSKLSTVVIFIILQYMYHTSQFISVNASSTNGTGATFHPPGGANSTQLNEYLSMLAGVQCPHLDLTSSHYSITNATIHLFHHVLISAADSSQVRPGSDFKPMFTSCSSEYG